ncbi:DNA polymerase III subunit beta [Acinetobacter haemolyticus]|uniref:DNA polymerase III subunit beta family protein n=1 Tax=Acinetobacter haemolyticus TaxID=29430 RepID=UPI0034D76D2C
MLNFEIPLVVLKAALICAAKNDVRFYLNGVAIDRGNVVSTDGHRLFYTEIDNINPEMQQVIIPREAIEYLSKKATGIKDLKKLVIVTLNGAEGKLAIQGTDIIERFRAIDGKFPEWKRIIPKADGSEYEGDYPTFNWQYLVDFQKIAKTLGDKCKVPQVKVTPTIGPSSSAHIDFLDVEFKARGVLMPLRA